MLWCGEIIQEPVQIVHSYWLAFLWEEVTIKDDVRRSVLNSSTHYEASVKSSFHDGMGSMIDTVVLESPMFLWITPLYLHSISHSNKLLDSWWTLVESYVPLSFVPIMRWTDIVHVSLVNVNLTLRKIFLQKHGIEKRYFTVLYGNMNEVNTFCNW